MFTAARLPQFHHTRDFLTKADTARAVNAARHIGCNQGAEILVDDDPLGFLVARRRCAIAHRQILQLAFAALIANGTVERVIDEQKLHHALLRRFGVGGVGLDLHSFGCRCGAGRQWLWCLFNLHQTHAAVRRDRQFFVIAKMRDECAELVRGLHHRGPALDRYNFAVNLKINHDYSAAIASDSADGCVE